MTKIVSRVGRNYQVRITRVGWEGSRYFAASKYGGMLEAVRDAHKWGDYVEERLPVIPPEPVEQHANIYEYEDKRPEHAGVIYFDVYVGKEPGDSSWSRKFSYSDGVEKIEAEKEAKGLLEERNIYLQNKYQRELAAWEKERDRCMAEIERLWSEVKEMPV